MLQATYNSLSRLHKRFGAREFGKLAQKFLAIGYHHAGLPHVVERGVQGVDVDAADGTTKYATEVKTTLGDAVVFQLKDANGLCARQADGYEPLLGVLRLSPLSDWLLVDAAQLEVGRLPLDRLRPYRRHQLEERIRPQFAIVVEEHAEGTMTGAQAYLDGVLRRLGIEQRDE